MSYKLLFCLTLFSTIEICFSNLVDVQTSSGLVVGQTIHVLNTSIVQYLGIPYAQPPTGDLRFLKPQPIHKPDDIIDGRKPKNSCPQVTTLDIPSFVGNLTQSEDCLFLNIWSPESDDQNSTQLKPVMFWIHGGGYSVGSSYQSQYNASALASHGVVVVTINYRLGVLGFLYTGDDEVPGNVGLYDQLLALKWVRENIHLFGGDKNEITIFGESAGSMSVSAHMLSPLAQGLFRRAIMESGSLFHYKGRWILTKEETFYIAKRIAKQFNCSENNEIVLKCLQKIDVKDLMVYTSLPVEETEFLPTSAQLAFMSGNISKDIDLMAGVARDEGSMLSQISYPMLRKDITENDFEILVNKTNDFFHGLDVKKAIEFYLRDVNTSRSHDMKWAFYRLNGDLLIYCPTYLFSKYYGNYSSNNNIYFYQQTYKRTGAYPEWGVTHTSDIDFVFGLPILQPKDTDTQTDRDFSYEVMKMWTNFAKNGKPNTNWPQLINTGDENPIPKIQELNPNKMNHIIEDLFHETCDGFWSEYYNN